MRRRDASAWSPLLVGLLGLACRCGGDSSAERRDAGPDRTDQDRAADGRLDDADGAEDGALSEEGGADAGDDAFDAPDYGECGRDVPLWERTLGEEWCFDPPTRDLNPLRHELAAGCEEVSFCHCGINIWDGYDVWDHYVAYLAPSEGVVTGTVLVDLDTWTEYLVEPVDFEVPDDQPRPDFPAVGSEGLVVEEEHLLTLPAGTWVVHWDPERRRKRILFADPGAGARGRGNFGLYILEDVFGTVAVAQRIESSGADANLRSIHIDTLANEALTEFPGGGYFWRVAMWGEQVVFSSGWGIGGVSVVDRTPTTVVGDGWAQWEPAIHENRLCWTDLRFGHGDPGASHWGEEIFCTDIGSGRQTNVSEAPGYGKMAPAVFGDWVAWQQYRYRDDETPSGPPFHDIVLYNFRIAQRRSLIDRVPSFASFAALIWPRLWGDYVYFLVFDPTVEGRSSELYRCHLPTVFPEAYE